MEEDESQTVPKKAWIAEQPNTMKPIALIDVEIKLINSAIKNRLVEIATIKNMIPELSFGFKKHVSASTCVNYVVNSVHMAKEYEKEVFVVFLDVSMAYDSVSTSSLLRILADLGVPEKNVSWLYEYLKY